MKVNLGGVCKGKDWRDDFVRKFDNDNILFFNPLKVNWKWSNEAKMEKENRIKSCDFLVYFITPEIEGFSSIASAVDYSNKYPKKLLFCAVESFNNKKFSAHQWESMKVVKDIVMNNGGLVFETLDEIADYLKNAITVPYNRT